MKDLIFSDKELTCLNCGFVTWGYKDMILHLAQEQKYKSENCIKQVIKIEELSK